MRSTNIRRSRDAPDPSLALIKAQVAFRLVRGDTWDQILVWWRRRYPQETMDLLYEARDEAERNAEYARKYRELRPDQQIGDIL